MALPVTSHPPSRPTQPQLDCLAVRLGCAPPIIVSAVGYTAQDVSYRWTTGRGVNIASDMKLSQFDLISTPTGNQTIQRSNGSYSTLMVSFHLQRHMGDFVIQAALASHGERQTTAKQSLVDATLSHVKCGYRCTGRVCC